MTTQNKSLGNPLLALAIPALIKTGVAVGIAYGGYKLITGAIADGKTKGAEKEMDTPEGQIASELASEFDKWGSINQTTYVNIMSRVKPGMSDKVFSLYKKLTGRFLTSDIRNDVTQKTQERVKKVQAWNANEFSTINIVNDKIVYRANVGSWIRFTPGQKSAIALYKNPQDIQDNKVHQWLQPSALAYKILEIKEHKETGWVWNDDEWHPVTKSKTWAMAQINISKTKTPLRLWVNMPDMITLEKHSVNGLGSIEFSIYI